MRIEELFNKYKDNNLIEIKPIEFEIIKYPLFNMREFSSILVIEFHIKDKDKIFDLIPENIKFEYLSIKDNIHQLRFFFNEIENLNKGIKANIKRLSYLENLI